jgi:hypothetical protein
MTLGKRQKGTVATAIWSSRTLPVRGLLSVVYPGSLSVDFRHTPAIPLKTNCIATLVRLASPLGIVLTSNP